MEQDGGSGSYRRIKIYNKLLALLTSKSAMASLGMNTKDIYYASLAQDRELKEACQHGLARIEISYYASTLDAEAMLFAPDFLEQASNDMRVALSALNSVGGLGH